MVSASTADGDVLPDRSTWIVLARGRFPLETLGKGVGKAWISGYSDRRCEPRFGHRWRLLIVFRGKILVKAYRQM
jgi:hypothetical protein